jgi:hypothetical protein
MTFSEPAVLPGQPATDATRYAQCLRNSERIRWDIDQDVVRGREFDFSQRFLPEGLSQLARVPFLEASDQRLLSQIQGRTYANVFGLVERFINAKVLELSRGHWFGDQVALEALVRFSEEELKHQKLFRRIELMIGSAMPAGYHFALQPDEVAKVVLGKSTWSVLALTCHIELFTQAHYRESIAPDPELSPLYKDVFLYHWKEESQHAILDELEWLREDRRLNPAEREAAVDDFIALVGAVDQLLQLQAPADARYFLEAARGHYGPEQVRALGAAVLGAYRWQYIVSGARHPRFIQLSRQLMTEQQRARVARALLPLLGGGELQVAR